MTTQKQPKKKVIQNPLNFILKSGKKITGPSMTVPDQSMSMRELLHRFANNAPINAGAREPIYLGEDGEGIDMRTLDLAERQEIIKAAEIEMEDIKKRLKQAKDGDKKMREIEAEQEQQRLRKEEFEAEQKELQEKKSDA